MDRASFMNVCAVALGASALSVATVNQSNGTASTKPVIEQSIRVRRIELIDDTGAVRATLGKAPHADSEAFGLHVLTPDGKWVASLQSLGHGGSCFVASAANGERVTLSTASDPGLTVHDHAGNERVALFIDPREGRAGTPTLWLRDAAECIRVGLAVHEPQGEMVGYSDVILGAGCASGASTLPIAGARVRTTYDGSSAIQWIGEDGSLRHQPLK